MADTTDTISKVDTADATSNMGEEDTAGKKGKRDTEGKTDTTGKKGKTDTTIKPEATSKLNATTKPKKAKPKRLSKSKRTHIRRMKAEARKEGVVYRPEIQ